MTLRGTRWMPVLALALLLVLALAHPCLADDDPPDDPPEGGEVEGDGDGGAAGEGDGDGGDGDQGDGDGGEGEAEGDGDEGGEGDPEHVGYGGETGGSGFEGFENVGPGTLPQARAYQAEFHPTYNVKYNRDQDVSSWNHDFDMLYRFTRRLKFDAKTSITIRENEPLNRLNRQESWTAGLDFQASDAVNMSVKYKRNQQIDRRNPGESNETKSARTKETMDFTTSFRRSFYENVTTSLSASAGLETNDYADVKSQGSAQNVSASVDYEPTENFATGFSYSGRHSLLDATQNGTTNTNESTDQSINGRASYIWGPNSVEASARRNFSLTQYPKEGETEERDQESESVGVTTTLQPSESLQMNFSYDYSRNQSYYQVEDSRDNDIKSRSVSGTVTYELLGARVKAELRSEKNRNEHFSFQSGDTFHDTFGAAIARDFGERFDVDVHGRTSLLSYHYDDTEENDQDRDLFDQEVWLTASYKPRNDISTDIRIRAKENQLIYMRTSRTGDNKTTRTYSITPSIRKSFGPRVSAKQIYELSADYTFYTYDEDSNFLIRNFVITTEVDWKPLGGIDLGFKHRYRGQDEGSYIEYEDGVERYGKNSERDDHTLTLDIRHKLFGFIDIEVKQEYTVQQKWNIDAEGSRTLAWDKFDTTLSGRASMDYELDDGSTLRASIGRTLRDATNINERQEDVWNISVSIDRTF